jgi:hypothetical protein
MPYYLNRRTISQRIGGVISSVALLVSCGGGGGSSGSSTATDSKTGTIEQPVALGDNVVPISVDAGPNPSTYQVNSPYVSVTVCAPGTRQCQTIEHVLLDTGSVGLRLLASQIPSTLTLPPPNANNVFSCQQYLDGSFTWGAVKVADIQLGSKLASNVPIQLISAPSSAQSANCSFGNSNSSSAHLGANGILGIGFNREDCGSQCVTQANSGYYYACNGNSNSSSCTATTMPLAQQIQNPVARLGNENNGFVIVLPSVPNDSADTLQGSLLLGVGTQSNNLPGNVTKLQVAGSNGYISATLASATTPNTISSFPNSFLDTGSNGLFFNAAIAGCVPSNGFYCPSSTQNFTLLLSDSMGAEKNTTIAINNASTLFSKRYHALVGLGGSIGAGNSMDLGLPFFYGKSIYFGLEGMPSSLGTGPYYAF